MNDSHDLRRFSRKALASIFPDRKRAEIIAQDAGLGLQQIDLSGPPIIFWENILEEAERQGKNQELLERALEDAPASPQLHQLLEQQHMLKQETHLHSSSALSKGTLTTGNLNNKQSVRQSSDMNLESGLETMKARLKGGDSEIYLCFLTLQSRLLRMIYEERTFGSNETVRSDMARIIQELNRLALGQWQLTFSELCLE